MEEIIAKQNVLKVKLKLLYEILTYEIIMLLSYFHFSVALLFNSFMLVPVNVLSIFSKENKYTVPLISNSILT